MIRIDIRRHMVKGWYINGELCRTRSKAITRIRSLSPTYVTIAEAKNMLEPRDDLFAPLPRRRKP